MSLIDPLLRFIDPVEYRERVASRRRARDARPRRREPEDAAASPARASPRDRRRRCRVCGRVEVTRYCLDCLADTMEDVR